jgi:hypothetical protein
MAKLSVTRLFDATKVLSTKAGEELADLIDYVNTTTSEIIRALRNGLTFSDNFACITPTVSLKHDTEQVISTDGKTPVNVLVGKVGVAKFSVDRFGWYINSSNQLVCKIFYSPVPSSTEDTQSVNLIILF